MNALLIPLKDSRNAKTRLAGLLSLEERARLAWAMFEDVSRAVEATTKPDRVALVSSFAPAIDRARSIGWEVLVEEAQESESASIDWASRLLAEQGFEAVMRLPADIPLVQARDIDELLSIKLQTPGAILVPSREGTGTNTIIRTPPELFPSRFGPDSLMLHKREAARVGVICEVVNNPRIALDIDEPSDLRLLLQLGAGGETQSLIGALRIEERLTIVGEEVGLTPAAREP